MRKLNSIILACVLIPLTLSGCGMSGPLYQEEDKAQAETVAEAKITEQNIQNKTIEQQEP